MTKLGIKTYNMILISSEAAKISSLSSVKIDKYEYHLLITYSPFGKFSEKQLKIKVKSR